ncbi:MAG TPA: cytochrome c biogenesis protein CcdA [Rhodothermales bacterium]
MKRLFRYLVVVAAMLFLALPAGAQGARDSVDWAMELRPAQAAPGESVVAHVTARIRPGWKMYAMDSPAGRPVNVSIEDSEAFQSVGPTSQSEAHEGYDPNFDTVVRYFEGQAAFRILIQLASDAPMGSLPVRGTAVFMICNDRMCLPPTPVPIEANLVVAAASVGESSVPGIDTSAVGFTVPSMPQAGTTAPLSSDETALMESTEASLPGSGGGLWAFILLAAGAGIAALLTPCVFPMIPLTISYFTRHAESRSESLRMALVYGLSIVVTFTGLGVLAAILVGAAGAQTIAADPWVNLFIGSVFVIFALSLLGLFELRLPNGLLNYFNRQSSERSGYVGVLFMGLTLTLVSFSCTAPFVGGLLAATVNGAWGYPVIGMLVFSATFALPFFFFALFPKGLGALPRSGSWMNTVKVILGFIELAAALKFLSNADLIWGWNVISRPLAIAVTVVIFALAGLYLLGKLRLSDEPPLEQVGVLRLLMAVGFFGTALYMLPGLFGAPLNALDAYLPPRQGTDVSLLGAGMNVNGAPGASELDWYEEIDVAFAAAVDQQKPVFIDFTGYTCTNCRDMEANVFPRPDVAERLQNEFVLLRLYTDDLERGPDFQRYQLRTTGTVALPTYAILDPARNEVLARLSGLTPADEFVAFLEGAAARYGRMQLATLP